MDILSTLKQNFQYAVRCDGMAKVTPEMSKMQRTRGISEGLTSHKQLEGDFLDRVQSFRYKKFTSVHGR